MRIALPPEITVEDFGPGASVADLRGVTMGTTWSVRMAAPADIDRDAVHAAILARLAGIVAQMSHWESASLLSRFNRAAAGNWHRLPADFAAVIDHGLRIARESGGAFDPAIGRLVDLWGFGPVAIATLPDDDAVDAARQCSGWRRLAWQRDGRWLRQPGTVSLDLSGIAKGFAVDAVADLLADRGICHALVEIGGELTGRGVRPDREPWWVDLEAPPDSNVPPLRIALHGLAVATSGDYRRGSHTLDPRTGRPATNGVVSASVLHRSALEADAWATALTVLGPEEGVALADQLGIAARLVTAREEHLTAALEAMLED